MSSAASPPPLPYSSLGSPCAYPYHSDMDPDTLVATTLRALEQVRIFLRCLLDLKLTSHSCRSAQRLLFTRSSQHILQKATVTARCFLHC